MRNRYNSEGSKQTGLQVSENKRVRVALSLMDIE